jgi:hypothetical protein
LVVTASDGTAEPASQPQPQRAFPFPLQEGEQILSLVHRHWIYLWPLILGHVIAAIVPVVLLALLLNELGGLDGTVGLVFWLLAALYVLYWAVRLLLTWYRYRNDIWVITNQRLIDSYRRHPFDLRISTADLVNVQDMAVQRNGILQTMLDYGNIVCQTASEMQDFKLTGVPHPRSTQALVDRERDRERMRQR